MRNPIRAGTEAAETFIRSVILEERRDQAAVLARVLLLPLSKLLFLAVQLRRLLRRAR